MIASLFWSVADVLALSPFFGLGALLVVAVGRGVVSYRRDVAAARRRAEDRRQRLQAERRSVPTDAGRWSS